MPHGLKIFFDGGCRPNPGPMEAAIVVRGNRHFFDHLGEGSNTDAEWAALACAAALARELAPQPVVFIGDSREVTAQAALALSTGNAAPGPAATFLSLVAQCGPARVRWIKRQQNLAGIALESRRNGSISVRPAKSGSEPLTH